MSAAAKFNSSAFLTSADETVANPVSGTPKRSCKLVSPVVGWLITGEDAIPGSLTPGFFGLDQLGSSWARAGPLGGFQS